MILMATAMKTTKGEILCALHLSEEEVHFIEQSPDRPNVKYSTQFVDKNEPLEAAFSTLITELKTTGSNMPRTLAYYQTRKQCSVLFRVVEVFLGQSTFHGTSKPQNRIVEMYHVGTTSRVRTTHCGKYGMS